MRQLLASVVGFAFLAVGCDSGARTGIIPTAPSQTATVAPTRSLFTFAKTYTQITIGEAVSRRVADDDPRCVDYPEWPCQYFRLTAPSDGILDVVKTNSKGNLDLSFTDAEGRSWWYPVSVAVKGGATYQITVWEYEYPGAEFELRTSWH